MKASSVKKSNKNNCVLGNYDAIDQASFKVSVKLIMTYPPIHQSQRKVPVSLESEREVY